MDRVRVWTTPHGIVFRVFGLRINVSRSVSWDMYRVIQYRVSWRPRHGTKRGFTFGIMRPEPYVEPYVDRVLDRTLTEWNADHVARMRESGRVCSLCHTVHGPIDHCPGLDPCPACGRMTGTCVHTDPAYGWNRVNA